MLDKMFLKLERFMPVKLRWVLSHDGFKRYFVNTGWMFGGQMFSLVVSFFVGAWLARYLGPENYGVLSYAVAFVGLFGFVASLGVDGILIRELVAHPEKRDQLMGTTFRLKIIGGVITVLLVTISTILIKVPSLIRLIIILFSFSFILQAINVIFSYFQSEVKAKNNVKTVLISTIISSILKVAVIFFDKGVIWIVIVYVLEFVWQWIWYVLAYKGYGLKIKNWTFDKLLAREILKQSWPLMLASAASFIYLKIDQVMIGYLLGNYEVGIYAAGVKLAEIWYFVPGVICGSLFPAIVNAKRTSHTIYKRRLKALYLLMSGVAILIAIFSTILAPWIINVLFGRAYSASVLILQIYVWSGVGLFLGTAINQYFLSGNKSYYIFLYNFLSMAANIILNLILIPKIGLTGAAWATLISYSIGPVIVFLINKLGGFKEKNLIESNLVN